MKTNICLILILVSFFSFKSNSQNEKCGLCVVYKYGPSNSNYALVLEKYILTIGSQTKDPHLALRQICLSKAEALEIEKGKTMHFLKNLRYKVISENIESQEMDSPIYKENMYETDIVRKGIHERSDLSCNKLNKSLVNARVLPADYQYHKSQNEIREEQDRQHGYPTTAPATTSPNSFPGTN